MQNYQGQYNHVLCSTTHIASFMGTPNILSDLSHLRARRETAVPRPERARAEQLVRSDKFLSWLQSPVSSQLLVHGNYGTTDRVSGLSFVCLSLTNVLARYGDRFIPLSFFCGLHSDEKSDPQTGGRALIRSLIYQLLGHFTATQHIRISPQTLHDIQGGNLDALNSLFAHLLSLIPNDFTVVCLVDGAGHYERDELLSFGRHAACFEVSFAAFATDTNDARLSQSADYEPNIHVSYSGVASR